MLRRGLGSSFTSTIRGRYTLRVAHGPQQAQINYVTELPTGAPVRWRPHLMEIDYENLYRPGIVNQVPDAL